MARHDFHCNSCSKDFEAIRLEGIQCPFCSSSNTQWEPGKRIHVYKPFKEFWHPNLGPEPVHITSAKQLDRELEKRGLSIPSEKKGARPKLTRLPETYKEAKGW